MKKIKAEHILISLTLIFAALMLGYYLGGERVSGDFVIITQKDASESDVLTGGDGVSALDAVDEPEEPETNVVNEDRININTAGVAELTELPGIGEVIAGRIIEYRDEHGDFKNPSDIMNVNGIGSGVYSKIEGLITTGN